MIIMDGCSTCDFNPRSPHGERRVRKMVSSSRVHISTHAPRTGSDAGRYRHRRRCAYFNPRSPHGERHTPTNTTRRKPHISTHAPRTGSDRADYLDSLPLPFQPTLPARGATRYEEPNRVLTMDFNPRSPHGERLVRLIVSPLIFAFQPTLPARGATHYAPEDCHTDSDFNPRSPHGERLFKHVYRICGLSFQPTLPARGATKIQRWNETHEGFQPTLPARGATSTFSA